MNHESLSELKSPGVAAAESVRAPRSGRTRLREAEKLKVWVRAGGCCVLCGRYLLEGLLTGLEVSLGELAHIVGQQVSARSPRGVHPMPRADRDGADNVLLACESCHEEIDDQLVTGVLDVEVLMALKARHEQRIRHVTTLPDDRRSLVLRVVGQLRGNAVEVSRSAAAAVVTGDGRFPWFDLDRDRLGVEIDLRGVPGEVGADADYYAVACRVVDEVMDSKVRDAVKSGDVGHVSVFAFARLPLLVYLGSKLEDNYTVEVYQRHRASQSWAWDSAARERTFTVDTIGEFDGVVEAVWVLNVSGTVDPGEFPEGLAGLPQVTVHPDGAATPDALTARASLASFRSAVREVYAFLDAHKGIRRVHVFGALPPTAAVELGRAHDPHIHPRLVVHDRYESGYRVALEVS